MTLGGRLCKIRDRFLGRMDADYYRSRGAVIGEDVWIGPDVRLDPALAWLVTVGDCVTFAPRVTVLAHDASLYRAAGFTRYAPVAIGAHCFIGAGSIILPGVTVGAGSVIAAGSLVRDDVPPGTLVAGNPAQPLMTVEEFIRRQRDRMADAPTYTSSEFDMEERRKMREELVGRSGWFIDSDT